MRALVWWLRSAFCRHEWTDSGMTQVWTHAGWAAVGTKVLDHTLSVQRCTKCGWIWRQRL